MTLWDTSYTAEILDKMTDRERLLYWGFKPEYIINLPDGSAVPDYEAIIIVMQQKRKLKTLEQASLRPSGAPDEKTA